MVGFRICDGHKIKGTYEHRFDEMFETHSTNNFRHQPQIKISPSASIPATQYKAS